MPLSTKKQAFEYLTYKLIEWSEEFNSEKENDLSILKILKLTFFISAVGTNKDSKETLLDDIFNNYVAMPYGHVESDIYSYIKQDALPNIKISNTNSQLKDSFDKSSYEPLIIKRIDSSIDLLKSTNRKIICLPSFDLVDLSHSWYSWQKYYGLAKSEGIKSKSIPPQEIKKEDKIYLI